MQFLFQPFKIKGVPKTCKVRNAFNYSLRALKVKSNAYDHCSIFKVQESLSNHNKSPEETRGFLILNITINLPEFNTLIKPIKGSYQWQAHTFEIHL